MHRLAKLHKIPKVQFCIKYSGKRQSLNRVILSNCMLHKKRWRVTLGLKASVLGSLGSTTEGYGSKMMLFRGDSRAALHMATRRSTTCTTTSKITKSTQDLESIRLTATMTRCARGGLGKPFGCHYD